MDYWSYLNTCSNWYWLLCILYNDRNSWKKCTCAVENICYYFHLHHHALTRRPIFQTTNAWSCLDTKFHSMVNLTEYINWLRQLCFRLALDACALATKTMQFCSLIDTFPLFFFIITTDLFYSADHSIVFYYTEACLFIRFLFI